MNRIMLKSPLLLGFDEIERLLERTEKSDGYPPYNIERITAKRIRITLAVAGFAPGELSLWLEDNQLAVKGRQNELQDRTFLHRGIASRQFQKTFVLAEGLEVLGAELSHGMLSIELERKQQEPVVRVIPIRSGPARSGGVQPANGIDELEVRRLSCATEKK